MGKESGLPGAKVVEAIFFATLALPPPERSAYLEHTCRNDVTLRQRVEALLRAHEAPEGFLPELPDKLPLP
jgi:hypothetical protein